MSNQRRHMSALWERGRVIIVYILLNVWCSSTVLTGQCAIPLVVAPTDFLEDNSPNRLQMTAVYDRMTNRVPMLHAWSFINTRVAGTEAYNTHDDEA
jgi:hypothetical protein